MRLSLKGMTIAGGLLWGGAILFLGLINLVRPTYGVHFLQVISFRVSVVSPPGRR